MKSVLIDCDLLSGKSLRPLFGQSIPADQAAVLLARACKLTVADFVRREEEGVTILAWQQAGIAYSAGLRAAALEFVSLRFEPGALRAGQVTACLGSPPRYQAWYDRYPEFTASSVQVALIYLHPGLIAYGSLYLPSAAPRPPVLDDSLSVGMLSLFGPDWADHERRSTQSQPWPGSWQALDIRIVQP
jgi:hypothetical protein